jgi:hypothetical protein
MWTINKFLLPASLLMGAIILVMLAFLAGSIYQQNNPTTTVTTQTILNKVNDNAFLLTKTVYLDQTSKIVVDKGSDWENLWWGQTINAQSLMKINVGIDFKKLQSSDVNVDTGAKVITLKLPQAEVLDATLAGDIKVQSTSGILKYLLANDTNSDYNLALKQLSEDATAAVKSDVTIMKQARSDSIDSLKLLLKDTGYTIQISE